MITITSLKMQISAFLFCNCPCYPFIHLHSFPLYPFEFVLCLRHELTENCRATGERGTVFIPGGGGHRHCVFHLHGPMSSLGQHYICKGLRLLSVRSGTYQTRLRPHRCLATGPASPPHSSKCQHLLSIFFILISQGMKMTTKLQARRANFRHS